MNEEVLWYAARVSGLMAWVLACGCLICGLLVRSQAEDDHSPSRLWADDACRFFGITSLLFAAGHAASIVLGTTFDVSAQELISLRSGGAWLEVGLITGVLCGWVLLVANVLRLFEDRLPSAAGTVTTVLTAAVVVGGVYHGWLEGSDVRNPVTMVVIGVAAVSIMAAASLALGSTGDKPTDGGSLNSAGPGPGPAEAPELPELMMSKPISMGPDPGHDNGPAATNGGPSGFPVPEIRGFPVPEIEGARLIGQTESAEQGPAGVNNPEQNPPA
ncbi:MAG: hypothetical protein ACRBK7_33125 [Acidimicrobiales bacterium]